MLNILWPIFIIVSYIYGIFTGNVSMFATIFIDISLCTGSPFLISGNIIFIIGVKMFVKILMKKY